jgi:hypothetical protein
LLFTLFEQTGSALAVVKHLGEHHLLFPDRLWGQAHDGELVWKPLRHGRVLDVLHNPRYAGAFVYRRTQTRTRTLPNETPRVKGRTRRVAAADWPIVRHHAHPGYLSWEQFLRNQQRLDDNGTVRGNGRRGAVREGHALLQGLVPCGQGGRRLTVRYTRNGTTPSYECNQVHKQQGGRTCQFVRGDGVDAAVARLFLEAIQPAQLEVSLTTLEQIENQARQVERQWQLRLERARYEAGLARRRFLAVEPENRLVARNLEKDWNDKLAAVERLERERATVPPWAAPRLSPEERQRILGLAEDLPALWHAPTTTPAERKQRLRLLLKDVALTKEATTMRVALRWQTGAGLTVEVPRPPRSWDARRTAAAVVARVRARAPDYTDHQLGRAVELGRLAEWPGRVLYGEQGPRGPLGPRDSQRLPGRARRLHAGRTRRRPLLGPGGGPGPERQCVHHRRLVPVRASGWPPGYAARALVGPADARGRQPLTQAHPAPLAEAVVEVTVTA